MSMHLLSDGENVSCPIFIAVSLMMRSMLSLSAVILIFSRPSLVFLGRPRFFFGRPSQVNSLTGAGFCGRRGTVMLIFSSPSPRTFFGLPRFFFIGMAICGWILLVSLFKHSQSHTAYKCSFKNALSRNKFGIIFILETVPFCQKILTGCTECGTNLLIRGKWPRETTRLLATRYVDPNQIHSQC